MRKLLLRAALLTLLLCLLFPVSAYAETGTLSGDEVNLRAGPGLNYEVLGCFPIGTELTVLDRSDSQWYSVSVNGVQGFMSAQYIKLAESDVTPAPPAGNDGQSEAGYINAMYVRLRSGASMEAGILGEYNVGTVLTVTGHEGDWAAVDINGRTGYVFHSYVTLGSYGNSGDGQPAASTPAPAPEPTPTPAPAPMPVNENTTSGYLNADHVHMRTGPSTGYSIRGVFDRNQPVTVLGIEGDWVHVAIDGFPGYVFGAYVSTNEVPAPTPEPTPAPTPAPAPDNGSDGSSSADQPVVVGSGEKDGYISGNNVRFRASASISSEILAEYNAGKALVITGTAGEWTAVRIDGVSGFVYGSYVREGSITVPGDAGVSSDEGVRMAQFALQYVGYPYVWGAESPAEGFDCSGLAYYTYTSFGYNMYRVANDQTRNGVHVDAGDLQPGDLLCFYNGGSYCGHVGIYIGNGQFVHASTYTTGVIISELDGYYTNRGFEARRIAGTDKNGPGV